MELKSSTILITGGSSGIGLELVKQLTQQGANIIITGRNQDALDKARQQYPGIHTFQSDVSNAPVYSAAKAGVHAYTKALRLQLENTCVKVFEMIPPGVNTNLQNDWVMPVNPNLMMAVEKMVAVAIKKLLRNKPELQPALVGVIKFAGRLAPGLLIKIGHREFKKFIEIKK